MFRVKEDYGGNIGAAINAAKAAGGGEIYSSAGEYLNPPQVPIEPEMPISFRGDGPWATIWRWTTNRPWTFGLDIQRSAAGAGIYRYVENMGFIGPGSRTLGVAPNEMAAIRWTSKVVVRNCRIEGWMTGLHQEGDHQSLISSTCRQNLYGIWYSANPGTTEDQLVLGSTLTANLLTGVGVAGDAQMFGEYIDCHFGFQPFGVWGASGSANLMQSVYMVRCPFEAVGNEAIWDNGSGRAVVHSTFHDCHTVNQAAAPTYRLAGKPNAAWIDVGTLQGCHIDGSTTFASPLGESNVKASKGVSDLTWTRCPTAIANAATKPVFAGNAGYQNCELKWSGRTGRVYRAAVALDAGDLCKFASATTVTKTIGTGGIVAGVAAHPVPVNGLVVVIVDGPAVFNVDVDSSPAVLGPLVPGVVAGMVRAGTSPTVGWATAAKTNGKIAGVVRL